MKQGRSLAELAAELQRQRACKRDFKVDTRELVMLNGTELHFSDQEWPLTHPQGRRRGVFPQGAGRGQCCAQRATAWKSWTARFGFNETEQNGILLHLAAGGDPTQYGAIQAVTRAAQDVESYDRSVELEAIGGQLMHLNATEWARIAAPAR